MKQSNLYIFAYASIMVIVVAAILSFAAISLKPYQQKNKMIEKKKDILKSIGKGLDAGSAADKNTYIESEYAKYIKESTVINSNGDEVSGVDAFDIKLKAELYKPIAERNLPMFFATMDDGKTLAIIPLRGKGLWGPIWGYLALDEDMNTVVGATFDHKAETPGLGADINKDWFQDPFKGKKLFDGDKYVSITVFKGGAKEGDQHGVDAISGGTITSKALEDMVRSNIESYVTYLNNKRNN